MSAALDRLDGAFVLLGLAVGAAGENVDDGCNCTECTRLRGALGEAMTTALRRWLLLDDDEQAAWLDNADESSRAGVQRMLAWATRASVDVVAARAALRDGYDLRIGRVIA